MSETSKVTDMRKRRLARIASLVVLLACAAQGVPSAQAYDRSTCGSSVSWEDVDQFRVEAGHVDFGDDLHLGGAPQGTAVVCWDGNLQNTNATRVTLVGKLYRDSSVASRCAGATIVFLDGANGVRARRVSTLCSAAGGLASRVFNISVNLPVHKIRIELYQDPAGQPPQLQRVVFVTFGD